MNLLGMLAGGVAEKVASEAFERVATTLKDRRVSNYDHWLARPSFKDVLDRNDSRIRNLNLETLGLDPSQKEQVMDLVDFAREQNISSMEIEINNTEYKIDTKTLDLKPII